jgi:hypothetical protein
VWSLDHLARELVRATCIYIYPQEQSTTYYHIQPPHLHIVPFADHAGIHVEYADVYPLSNCPPSNLSMQFLTLVTFKF